MTSPNRPNPASSSLGNWDAAAMMGLWDRLQTLPARDRPAAVANPWLGDGRSLGAIQAAALTGYGLSFGDRIACRDRCPDCDTPLGVELSARTLIAAQGAAPDVSGVLGHGDWIVRYRLPSPADLMALTGSEGAASARSRLLRATVEAVTEKAADRDVADLPGAVTEALVARIEAEDPLAAAEMALDCPECGAHWESGFDACAVFLSRLEAWARRTLWEVHQLAMRYGWREADLLAMTPVRREAYLMMDAP